MSDLTFRNAEESDVSLILEFIRKLADYEHRLDEVNLTANKNAIPGDPESPFVTSGLRVGTPAVTTRGLNEEDMDKIAEYITLVLNDYENSKEKVRAGVEEICKKYPLYE